MVNANTGVASNETLIKAFVQDDQNVATVEARLQWNGTGPIEVLMMYDDGTHGDDDAGDGWYGVFLPAVDTSVVLSYSIAAIDVNGNESLNPVCGTYQVALNSSTVTLAINEFMASNTTIVTDEAGEYEDWVEIHNYGSASVYLGDYYLSDNSTNPTKWSFPDQSIEVGQYLVIWADEDQEQGLLHANFKLSAGGEFIGIFDSDANNNAFIDGLDFNGQAEDIPFGRYPNGTGPFMTLHPTPGSTNQKMTAVGDVTGPSEFMIYPNPVGDELTIELPGNVIAMNFEIVNSLGQIVYRSVIEDKEKIRTAELQPGLYFISWFSGSQNSIRRFFIHIGHPVEQE